MFQPFPILPGSSHIQSCMYPRSLPILSFAALALYCQHQITVEKMWQNSYTAILSLVPSICCPLSAESVRLCYQVEPGDDQPKHKISDFRGAAGLLGRNWIWHNGFSPTNYPNKAQYLCLYFESELRKQGPSGTKRGLEVNLEDKNQVRPGISPSP